jgi:hypothetical protein
VKFGTEVVPNLSFHPLVWQTLETSFQGRRVKTSASDIQPDSPEHLDNQKNNYIYALNNKPNIPCLLWFVCNMEWLWSEFSGQFWFKELWLRRTKNTLGEFLGRMLSGPSLDLPLLSCHLHFQHRNESIYMQGCLLVGLPWAWCHSVTAAVTEPGRNFYLKFTQGASFRDSASWYLFQPLSPWVWRVGSGKGFQVNPRNGGQLKTQNTTLIAPTEFFLSSVQIYISFWSCLRSLFTGPAWASQFES